MKKLFPFFVAIVFSLSGFAQPKADTVEEIFKVVEDMPHFVTEECNRLPSKQEKKICGDKALTNYIDKNLVYPKIASENGVQGRVIVTFVVEKNGEITDARILRDIGANCGKEALRLVSTFNTWESGKQRGKSVRVQYNLPIRFKLPKEEKAIVIEKKKKTVYQDEISMAPSSGSSEPDEVEFIDQAVEEEDHKIFKVVEEMPRFYSDECELIEDYKERKQCADKAMLKFIYTNMEYPALAKKNGVQGVVVVTYVVEKDGKITDAKVIRDIGADCGKEGLRLVNLMNDLPNGWIPGKQRGEPIRTQFNLPIRFKL